MSEVNSTNNHLTISFTYTKPDIADHFCDYETTKETNPGISTDECKALLDLYKESKGATWKKSKGWTPAFNNKKADFIRDICKWTGISCDTNNKLIEINLQNNNLQGSISDNFKALSSLRELNLSQNELSHVLSKLDNPLLIQLNLSSNPLSETLTASFFDKHPKLNTLILKASQLRGNLPNHFGTGIEKLDLSQNKLSGLLGEALTQLTKLQNLDLSENFLVEPLDSAFKSVTFPKLKSFNLSKNYFAELGKTRNYLLFKSNNPVLNSHIDPNLQQYQLTFLSSKQKEIHKREQATSAPIFLTVAKKLCTSTSCRIISNGDLPDLKIGGHQNLLIHSSSKSQYKIQLKKLHEDGFFLVNFQDEPQGQWTQTKLLISPGILPPPTGDGNAWTGATSSGNTTDGSLHFELGGKYLDQYFSVVHFNVAGNDFGGGFFWLPVVQLDKPVFIKTLNAEGEEDIKMCHNQIRGFYYNSQRGERLWPLDVDSQNALKKFNASTYEDLTMK